MNDLLILNANIINEGENKISDLWIKNGRIEKIAPNLSNIDAERTLDLNGKILIPGMIDDQVHFREPGFTHKGNIASESRAAVAGGITSYMEMPNCNPLTVTHEAISNKYELAAQKSLANYSFYLGATNDNIEQIKTLPVDLACGVKIFMGASTGNMLVDNPQTLEMIFANCPVLIATHCEDTPTILKNEETFKKKYGEEISIQHHPYIRSEEACYLSSSLAISLAKKHHSRLHVLHLTTEKELSQFDPKISDKQHITAEVCVHHLFFNENDYEDKGNLIKCNPAIKKASDQSAIIEAVKNDTIDIIATDHAPHTWDEKQQTYLKAPAGLPLVQHALVSLLEQYHKNVFSLEHIVKKICHAPADLFQIKERGYIREGYWADLVAIDLDQPHTVERANIRYKCGWSPFDGYNFKSSINTTIINGNIVYENDTINDDCLGKKLEFNRSR